MYTEIVVPDTRKKTLQRVIRGKVDLQSVIHSDNWRSFDGLIDMACDKYYRVQHGQDGFANPTSHINGIESFLVLYQTKVDPINGIQDTRFICIRKKPNFALTIETITYTRSY